MKESLLELWFKQRSFKVTTLSFRVRQGRKVRNTSTCRPVLSMQAKQKVYKIVCLHCSSRRSERKSEVFLKQEKLHWSLVKRMGIHCAVEVYHSRNLRSNIQEFSTCFLKLSLETSYMILPCSFNSHVKYLAAWLPFMATEYSVPRMTCYYLSFWSLAFDNVL